MNMSRKIKQRNSLPKRLPEKTGIFLIETRNLSHRNSAPFDVKPGRLALMRICPVTFFYASSIVTAYIFHHLARYKLRYMIGIC